VLQLQVRFWFVPFLFFTFGLTLARRLIAMNLAIIHVFGYGYQWLMWQQFFSEQQERHSLYCKRNAVYGFSHGWANLNKWVKSSWSYT